jgi:abortive infection bacteriophage resistance protein
VSWLESLTYVRNICAHHARLWNRRLSVRPELLREWKFIGVNNGGVYCTFLVLQHMLNHVAPSSKWKDRLMLHIAEFPGLDLNEMNFPTNWLEQEPWNLSRFVS